MSTFDLFDPERKKRRKQQMKEANARRCARQRGEDVPLRRTGPKVGSRFKIRHGTATEYFRHGCRCEPCREAARAHAKKYRNPITNRAGVKRNQQKNILRGRAAKNRPCVDCGHSYPYYVMQFDHLRDKRYDLGSSATRGLGNQKFYEEIAKCDVVCANCHMIRTHLRRQRGAA